MYIISLYMFINHKFIRFYYAAISDHFRTACVDLFALHTRMAPKLQLPIHAIRQQDESRKIRPFIVACILPNAKA